MQQAEIEQFVLHFLQATNCTFLEKTPSHVTVKLSPAADKALTHRPYYWSFIERTGAEPETMTYTFTFRPEEKKEWEDKQRKKQQKTADQANQSHSILGKFLGVQTVSSNRRIPEEHLHYGSLRLHQIFQIVREQGRYVCMYERPAQDESTSNEGNPFLSRNLESWLNVNYKVEFLCDMKRDEFHSLGICLSTGEITEQFFSFVKTLPLTPKLPARVHLTDCISLSRAVTELEKHLKRHIASYDHRWAEEAQYRLKDELQRIDSFYEEMLNALDNEEQQKEAKAQYERRKREIVWQHEPRIRVSVINCGYFHLFTRPPSKK